MRMGSSIWRDLVILLGVFALVWIGFSLFTYPDDPELMSVEKEEQLGDHYLEVMLANPMFGDFDKPEVDSVVQVIGKRLKQGLENSPYRYRFLVFENEMINAFTLPGGNILVSSGLIGFCQSPEELAAVMAHEMGHVEERHVLARLVKELSLEILKSNDPFLMGEVSAHITSTKFDRRQEEEADAFAAALLEQARVEPRSLASLFRRLEEEQHNELLENFEIVSTHPNFNSRIRATLLYRPAEDFEAESFGFDWNAVQEEL